MGWNSRAGGQFDDRTDRISELLREKGTSTPEALFAFPVMALVGPVVVVGVVCQSVNQLLMGQYRIKLDPPPPSPTPWGLA